MSKRSKPGRQAGKPAATTQKPSWARRATFLLAVAVLAGGAIWGWRTFTHPTPGPLVETAQAGTNNATASGTAQVRPEFEKLKGRWQRPDGGYVLEIRSVESNGKLDASYYNPNPIHVGRAAALQEGKVTKVFVELRDINYPGSTYSLVYDAQTDQLQGNYFQAIQQQNFDVFFIRMR